MFEQFELVLSATGAADITGVDVGLLHPALRLGTLWLVHLRLVREMVAFALEKS